MPQPVSETRMMHFSCPLCKLDPHRAAEAVVFDGVLRQVEEQTVDQRVAADQGAVALRIQRDAKLRKIGNIISDTCVVDKNEVVPPCHSHD